MLRKVNTKEVGLFGRRLGYLSLETPLDGQASKTHSSEIIQELEALGWRVTRFMSMNGGASSSSRLVSRAIDYIRVQTTLMRQMRSLDVIYVRSHFAALPVAIAASLLKIPVVQEINGKPDDVFVTYPSLRPLRRVIEWLYRAQLKRADHLFTVTDGLMSWACKFSGHLRASVVSNGANTTLFTATGDKADVSPPYAIFVGGLVAWHGIETMLSALDHPAWPQEVSLVILGDGTERHRLASRAEQPRLLWLGRKAYEEVPSYLRGALCALCVIEDPEGRSSTGVAPLKLFEAMACGVPVIVTDLPFQREIIRDNDAGLMISQSDPQALANAVAELWADKQKAQKLGTNGAKYVLRSASWRARAREISLALDRITGAADQDALRKS